MLFDSGATGRNGFGVIFPPRNLRIFFFHRSHVIPKIRHVLPWRYYPGYRSKKKKNISSGYPTYPLASIYFLRRPAHKTTMITLLRSTKNRPFSTQLCLNPSRFFADQVNIQHVKNLGAALGLDPKDRLDPQ